MSNGTLVALALLILLVEAAAMVWALARADPTAIVVLNLIGAAGVLIAMAPSLIAYRTMADDLVPFLFGVMVFELAIFATSILWFAQRRLTWLVWTEFGWHLILSAGVAFFILTFKIARLI